MNPNRPSVHAAKVATQGPESSPFPTFSDGGRPPPRDTDAEQDLGDAGEAGAPALR